MADLIRLVKGSSLRVRVPASSANIGPGFDSIGLALGIWDECVATVTAEPGLSIDVVGEGGADVPRDARHLVHRSMVRAWEQLGVKPPAGLRLSCRNAIPHGRGLGSSASAIVAGIVAAQGLCDMAMGRDRADNSVDFAFTNNLATAIEGHPDNASASVFGGMTLSWADDVDSGQIHSVQLEVTADVIPLLFIPATQLPTATARAVLPEQIPHCVAAQNSARVGLLVEAVTRRPDLLLAATREWLHQEQRRSFFQTRWRCWISFAAKDMRPSSQVPGPACSSSPRRRRSRAPELWATSPYGGCSLPGCRLRAPASSGSRPEY